MSAFVLGTEGIIQLKGTPFLISRSLLSVGNGTRAAGENSEQPGTWAVEREGKIFYVGENKGKLREGRLIALLCGTTPGT